MKNIATITILLLLPAAMLTAQKRDSAIYKILDPYYFHLTYLSEDPALMVDAREGFEYRRRRIKDAVHIPNVRSLNIAADTLTRDYSIFIYCTTDTRAIGAARQFHERGFRKIYLLEGGLALWRKEGMPLDRSRKRRGK